VVVFVDDLFFAVKIRETARQGGLSVDVVGATQFQAALDKRVAEGALQGVIVDLNSPAALEVIGRLKHEARTHSFPIIGFVSHVATNVIAAARAAGCDEVLARSAFTKRLPQILHGLVQGSTIGRQGSENEVPVPEPAP
jgi:DNA-binding NarL/FixJ family response regulator